MAELYGGIDYEKIREKLREEVSWRRGIRWFLGTSPNRPFKESMHGMCGQIFGAEETPDGDVLVCDRFQVLIVSRDYKVKFRYGDKNTPVEGDGEWGNAVYNWETGRILWSVRGAGKIVEIDPSTGEKTLEITSIGGTALQRPSASYEFEAGSFPPDPTYTGAIWVADPALGKVWLIERDGSILYEVTHGHPYYAEGYRTYVAVAFYDEHKILFMDVTGPTVNYGVVLPYPTSVRMRGIARYMASSDHFRPQIWTGDGYLGALPFLSERWISETSDMTYFLTLHGDLYEIDLRSILPLKPTVPIIFPNIINASLDANTESDIYPLPLYAGITRARIYAWADQNATLKIYVPRPRGGGSELLHEVYVDPTTWNPTWREIDSVAISGGKQVRYIFDSPLGLFGVSVLMGATAGTYDLWCIME